MTGKTHSTLSILCVLVLIYLSKQNLSLWMLVGAYLGSLFPDSDCRYTLMGKLIPLWKWFDHRGPTHSIEFNIMISLPLTLVFGIPFGLGWFIGHLSHTLIDMLNNGNVMVSWIFKKKAGVNLIKVYSGEEWMLAFIFSACILFLVSEIAEAGHLKMFLWEVIGVGKKYFVVVGKVVEELRKLVEEAIRV